VPTSTSGQVAFGTERDRAATALGSAPAKALEELAGLRDLVGQLDEGFAWHARVGPSPGMAAEGRI
jgi:hypothetical protein